MVFSDFADLSPSVFLFSHRQRLLASVQLRNRRHISHTSFYVGPRGDHGFVSGQQRLLLISLVLTVVPVTQVFPYTRGFLLKGFCNMCLRVGLTLSQGRLPGTTSSSSGKVSRSASSSSSELSSFQFQVNFIKSSMKIGSNANCSVVPDATMTMTMITRSFNSLYTKR